MLDFTRGRVDQSNYLTYSCFLQPLQMCHQSMAAEVELRRSVVVHCPRLHSCLRQCHRHLQISKFSVVAAVIEDKFNALTSGTTEVKATIAASSLSESATIVRHLTIVAENYGESSFASHRLPYFSFVSTVARSRRRQVTAVGGRSFSPEGAAVNNTRSCVPRSRPTACSTATRRKRPTGLCSGR
jgi:hypothetical protein